MAPKVPFLARHPVAQLIKVADVRCHAHHEGKEATNTEGNERNRHKDEPRILRIESPPFKGVPHNGNSSGNKESIPFAPAVGHPADNWNDNESSDNRTDGAEPCRPVAGCPVVPPEHVVENDEEGKGRDQLEAIENEKGGCTEADKGNVTEGLRNPLEDIDDGY
jgi:hypothetical protein